MKTHFGHERWHQAASLALRYEVFVLEQGISLIDEFDSLDTADRNYFSIYQNQLIIGTVRFQYKDSQTLQPDRLCIKKEFRQQGLGTQLLLGIEQKAINEGIFYSELSAEEESVSFYEKNGYTTHSEPFLEDGIQCIKMIKSLEN